MNSIDRQSQSSSLLGRMALATLLATTACKGKDEKETEKPDQLTIVVVKDDGPNKQEPEVNPEVTDQDRQRVYQLLSGSYRARVLEADDKLAEEEESRRLVEEAAQARQKVSPAKAPSKKNAPQAIVVPSNDMTINQAEIKDEELLLEDGQYNFQHNGDLKVLNPTKENMDQLYACLFSDNVAEMPWPFEFQREFEGGDNLFNTKVTGTQKVLKKDDKWVMERSLQIIIDDKQGVKVNPGTTYNLVPLMLKECKELKKENAK